MGVTDTGRTMVLTLNAGSSSVKFAVYGGGEGQARLVSGMLEGVETSPRLSAQDADGKVLVDRQCSLTGDSDPHLAAIDLLMGWIDSHLGLDALAGVGHRVVHGGPDFHLPIRVDARTLGEMERLMPFDPLHLPACLGPIRALLTAHPDLPQIACFDTAFHAGMPDAARRLALPRRYDAAGVRRYGFHGLSYEYIAAWLSAAYPDLARGRVLAAHIGNGASLCAMQVGRSVATTMGFSVLDGLVMGTRPGALDPAVLLYMMRQEGLGADDIEKTLYHESGLLGVSGVSSDMRTLRQRENEPDVREALDLCIHRFTEQAGAMIAAMGGVDGIVFTGGVGEHDAAFRAEACARLAFLGVQLADEANLARREVISAAESRVRVLVRAADEEATIHRHVRDCLGDHAKRNAG
ncbi:acetate/propionate family kinase [Acidomonas methanolica]|uniref:Acetate kinase n=1 Tax=Acidomonas methanolica NBRC 104435 TaxID=1231351 RepID=A0A023D4X9_ACIMT|nr:acetate/propionate family kinase [Acidomonas methanolica]TCS28419.1 acetate kinase [Acidomonas methanolica]GAJ29203.1 acetate kinase [Acidomonas methanolica NBRC 104435]GEK99559.1 acetate kinase [Acidomonas methanolica NBRC 104435]